MGPEAAARVLDLRRVLAERFPGAAGVRGVGGVVPTGLACLDVPLGGGLPSGEVVEIVAGAPSSGAGLLLVALLWRALGEQPCVALVDGSDSFDPADLPAGLLRRLLWVRCLRASDALRPVDALLRDGNVPLVVLDLRGNASRELAGIPQHGWFRFQRVAAVAGTALVVISPRPQVRAARWRLRVDSRFDLAALGLGRAELLEALRVGVMRGRGAGASAAAG